MPLLKYQLFICFRKFFNFGQFAQLETLRLTQFHVVFHVEYGFTAAMADVDVNRAVVVAVKEKPEPVLFKNGGHESNYLEHQFANVRVEEARATGDQKVHARTLTTKEDTVERLGDGLKSVS
jgi:hypothetical protein